MTDSSTNHDVLPPLGSCNWIPWDSEFIQKKLPDPTRLFSFLVCGVMFFRFLEASDCDFEALFTGFVINPYVLIFLAIATLTLYLGLVTAAKETASTTTTKSPSPSLWEAWQSLPVFDRWAAEWYWWNAWLYHGVMDGASGTLQAVPVVVSQYQVLDRRFSTHHSVPWIVGLVEIIFHQSVCLWTLYAVVTKSPYRFPLEIITAILHMFGAVVFVFAEVYEGQFNVPALDPVGIPGNRFGNIKWTSSYQFVYYWFGFWFCNFVWIWVPLYRLQRAVQECVRSFEISQQQQQQHPSTSKPTKKIN
ncbi:hypothetical protein ACA910_016255 [Epithemia clementina (nom. ined.)]